MRQLGFFKMTEVSHIILASHPSKCCWNGGLTNPELRFLSDTIPGWTIWNKLVLAYIFRVRKEDEFFFFAEFNI